MSAALGPHMSIVFFQGYNLCTKRVCLRELRGLLFSLQNRLRELTLAIALPTRTTRHSWAIDNSMQHEPLLAHKTYQLRRLRGRDYYRCLRETTPQLLPAGKRLREHSCSFTSITALTHLKKRCSYEPYPHYLPYAMRCLHDLGAAMRSPHDLGPAMRSLHDLVAAMRSLHDLGAAMRSLHDLGAASYLHDLRAAMHSLHDLGAAMRFRGCYALPARFRGCYMRSLHDVGPAMRSLHDCAPCTI